MDKLGTIALSSDILQKANIGLWAFELDEGKPPRMYADEAMMKLIALTEVKTPEETYHAWYILEEYGLTVDTAENGEIAVEKYAHADRSGNETGYDVILMDVQMPVMNGYDATRMIRSMKIDKENRVPIIAMTANAFAEDRQRAIDCGMDDHLAKPIDRKMLEKVLVSVLK